jgi:DNA-binding MarR family transcriptional regulator
MLMERGETTIGELAESLGLERTTLTRNLAVLEAQGWVNVSIRDADARSRFVKATSKGRKVISAALPAWRRAQAAATAAVGPSGLAALYALSDRNLS